MDASPSVWYPFLWLSDDKKSYKQQPFVKLFLTNIASPKIINNLFVDYLIAFPFIHWTTYSNLKNYLCKPHHQGGITDFTSRYTLRP